jgi:hypothetical protein
MPYTIENDPQRVAQNFERDKRKKTINVQNILRDVLEDGKFQDPLPELPDSQRKRFFVSLYRFFLKRALFSDLNECLCYS